MAPFVEADPGTPSQINPQDTPLVVTEPVFNLPNVQDHYDQIVFEEYEFQSYLRCPGALSRFADVGAISPSLGARSADCPRRPCSQAPPSSPTASTREARQPRLCPNAPSSSIPAFPSRISSRCCEGGLSRMPCDGASWSSDCSRE